MIYIKQNIEELLIEQSGEPKWFWMVGDIPDFFDPDNTESEWDMRAKNRFHQIMEELSNGELNGVLGVSESKNIIKSFFGVRNFYIQMPADEFLKLNNSEKLIFNSLDYLVKNNFYFLRRLFNNINDLPQAFTKLFNSYIHTSNIKNNYNINLELFNSLIYYINYGIVKSGQSELESYIKSISGKNFTNFEHFLDEFYEGFAKNNRYFKSKVIEYSYFSQIEDIKYVIKDAIKQIFENGLKELENAFGDEKEWIINEKSLKIPPGSRITFKLPIQSSNYWAENQKTKDMAKWHPYTTDHGYKFLRLFWDEYKKYKNKLNDLYDINFIDDSKYEKVRNKKLS